MISFFGFKEKTNFIKFCLYQEKNIFQFFEIITFFLMI